MELERICDGGRKKGRQNPASTPPFAPPRQWDLVRKFEENTKKYEEIRKWKKIPVTDSAMRNMKEKYAENMK